MVRKRRSAADRPRDTRGRFCGRLPALESVVFVAAEPWPLFWTDSFRLLKLPPEIRLRIYQETCRGGIILLRQHTQRRYYKETRDRSRPHSEHPTVVNASESGYGLIQTSRFIREESSAIFFHDTAVSTELEGPSMSTCRTGTRKPRPRYGFRDSATSFPGI